MGYQNALSNRKHAKMQNHMMSWLMATPWMGIASASCETKLAEST
jgi:hypothetical protein